MNLSNYSIVLPIGELRVAENPNFVPGELYRWTDVWAKKSYVLELREEEKEETAAPEDEVRCEDSAPAVHRNTKLYREKLTLEESEKFREWFQYAKFKTKLGYMQIADGSGINFHSLHLYCIGRKKRVPVAVRDELHKFFLNLGQKGGEQ